MSSPFCPSCDRPCKRGATWHGANYCRGLALLRYIEDQPGLSGWELAQLSGIPYSDATRGLAKLREFEVVEVAQEALPLKRTGAKDASPF